MKEAITITFTGEQGNGKSRFMRALVDLLKEHGVSPGAVNANTTASDPGHTFRVTSEDATRFAEAWGH